MAPVLRLRFGLHFRPARRWHRRVAEEVRLPTWHFETVERGDIVFARTQEPLGGHEAIARLFLHETLEAGAPATCEIALRGKWKDEDEAQPPLGLVQGWLDEAAALLVLLGVRKVHTQFIGAYRTRR